MEQGKCKYGKSAKGAHALEEGYPAEQLAEGEDDIAEMWALFGLTETSAKRVESAPAVGADSPPDEETEAQRLQYQRVDCNQWLSELVAKRTKEQSKEATINANKERAERRKFRDPIARDGQGPRESERESKILLCVPTRTRV